MNIKGRCFVTQFKKYDNLFRHIQIFSFDLEPGLRLTAPEMTRLSSVDPVTWRWVTNHEREKGSLQVRLLSDWSLNAEVF